MGTRKIKPPAQNKRKLNKSLAQLPILLQQAIEVNEKLVKENEKLLGTHEELREENKKLNEEVSLVLAEFEKRIKKVEIATAGHHRMGG